MTRETIIFTRSGKYGRRRLDLQNLEKRRLNLLDLDKKNVPKHDEHLLQR